MVEVGEAPPGVRSKKIAWAVGLSRESTSPVFAYEYLVAGDLRVERGPVPTLR